MGKLLHIKTDNGPGCTSTAFKAFCSSYKILHTTGISYNPQGQAIVEQAHQTLKVQLQIQEGGDSFPDTQISKALFTLIFKVALNLALLQLKNIGNIIINNICHRYCGKI
jgi:hypothetical protein